MPTTDDFFAFMVKREELRLRKEAGVPWPWSDDWILNTYKFTNVKREHDRTTRWMRKYWTGPHSGQPPGEILFNCAVYRYFGTYEFAAAIGWQRDWQPHAVSAVAEERRRSGLRVFTGAYIIPTLGYRGPKSEAVCVLILNPLWEAKEVLAELARTTHSWRAVAERMRILPGFGGTGFMTKEVLQDLIHTPVLSAAIDRNTWCPAGPGSRRGLNRLLGRPVNTALNEREALTKMLELFESAKTKMPGFMPALELHDIQFQLCEFDKYERARLGEGRPKARYVRPASEHPAAEVCQA